MAYGEMGLPEDAIREVSVCLMDFVEHDRAEMALNWIFSLERTQPNALAHALAMIRTL